MPQLDWCSQRGGVWHEMAMELAQETGRLITTLTEDTRETVLLQPPFYGSSKSEFGLPEHDQIDHRVKRCYIHYTFLLLQ